MRSYWLNYRFLGSKVCFRYIIRKRACNVLWKVARDEIAYYFNVVLDS